MRYRLRRGARDSLIDLVRAFEVIPNFLLVLAAFLFVVVLVNKTPYIDALPNRDTYGALVELTAHRMLIAKSPFEAAQRICCRRNEFGVFGVSTM